MNLQVKAELLVNALTKRKAMTANDMLILPYSLSEVRLHIFLVPNGAIHLFAFLTQCVNGTSKHVACLSTPFLNFYALVFRLSLPETRWPSLYTVLCLTGFSCESITLYSIRETWRSLCR